MEARIDPKHNLSPEEQELYGRVTYDREPTAEEKAEASAEAERIDRDDE